MTMMDYEGPIPMLTDMEAATLAFWCAFFAWLVIRFFVTNSSRWVSLSSTTFWFTGMLVWTFS